jgi:hypothetical protein
MWGNQLILFGNRNTCIGNDLNSRLGHNPGNCREERCTH